MTIAAKPALLQVSLLAALPAGLLLGAAPAAAQDAVTDFQLKPGADQGAAAQGPVADDVVPPRAVSVPTPTPTSTTAPTPTPTPSPTGSPSAQPASPPPSPSATPTAARPAASSRPPAARPSTAPTTSAPPSPAASAVPSSTPTPSATSPVAGAGQARSALPASPATISETPQAKSSLVAWWQWLLALLAAIGAAVLVFAWRRRHQANRVPEVVRPVITRPQVAPQPGAPPAAPQPVPPPAPPAPGEDDEAGLRVAFEARQLSISLAAATLDYRLTLTNAGEQPIRGLAVAGDMIAAHASRAEGEQLASRNSRLVQCHALERLAPGETRELTGQFRLPLNHIMAIRQGEAALFVPLARLRFDGAEGIAAPLVQNAVVGQRSPRPGAGLQPFRLDLGPRIYREVTQRIFA